MATSQKQMEYINLELMREKYSDDALRLNFYNELSKSIITISSSALSLNQGSRSSEYYAAYVAELNILFGLFCVDKPFEGLQHSEQLSVFDEIEFFIMNDGIQPQLRDAGIDPENLQSFLSEIKSSALSIQAKYELPKKVREDSKTDSDIIFEEMRKQFGTISDDDSFIKYADDILNKILEKGSFLTVGEISAFVEVLKDFKIAYWDNMRQLQATLPRTMFEIEQMLTRIQREQLDREIHSNGTQSFLDQGAAHDHARSIKAALEILKADSDGRIKAKEFEMNERVAAVRLRTKEFLERRELFWKKNSRKIKCIGAVSLGFIIFANGMEDHNETRGMIPGLGAVNAAWDIPYMGIRSALVDSSDGPPLVKADGKIDQRALMVWEEEVVDKTVDNSMDILFG